MPTSEPPLTVSIVSHGHGPMVAALLGDLVKVSELDLCIVLTLNVPEDESFLAPYHHLPLTIIRNAHPKGFGANHNAAFMYCHSPYFVIANPDLRLPPNVLGDLMMSFPKERAGAIGPLVLNEAHQIEDSARRFPQVFNLLHRYLKRRFINQSLPPDYDSQIPLQRVDWLAGMLILFSKDAYHTVDGFDEAYFMYAEDIDIAKRLARAGYECWWNTRVHCMHAAQRASHRSFKHFYWHCQSVLRYFYRHGH